MLFLKDPVYPTHEDGRESEPANRKLKNHSVRPLELRLRIHSTGKPRTISVDGHEAVPETFALGTCRQGCTQRRCQ
jgi:hypothetical protein